MIYISLFLYLESWSTRLIATISPFLFSWPLKTFPKVPYPIWSIKSTSSLKRHEGVESRLVYVNILLCFLRDFFRLNASRLFEILTFYKSKIDSFCSFFHFAWERCCFPFLSPLFSFSRKLRIGEPISVCSFLGSILEILGDINLSLVSLLEELALGLITLKELLVLCLF